MACRKVESQPEHSMRRDFETRCKIVPVANSYACAHAIAQTHLQRLALCRPAYMLASCTIVCLQHSIWTGWQDSTAKQWIWTPMVYMSAAVSAGVFSLPKRDRVVCVYPKALALSGPYSKPGTPYLCCYLRCGCLMIKFVAQSQCK